MATEHKQIDNKINHIQQLVAHYNDFPKAMDNTLLNNLQNLAKTFAQDAKNALESNRLLRIGIVGQIKRGKSSFLNSLLFSSQDVLPKAATPMTAALTRIRYADKPSASVSFYSVKEWQKITERAEKVLRLDAQYEQARAQYKSAQTGQKKTAKRVERPLRPDHAEEDKACLELFNMVQSSAFEVSDYLGKTQQIGGEVSSNRDLVDRLHPYVGAQGQFTPIVKSTELAMTLDGLQGIEVVDTPGMNDPIISRGRMTQEFLGQCDVIFLLSACGQFLDMHDMQLLAQNIPHKGIDEIVLIGSMFDSVLLDEYSQYATIQEALPALTKKLADQAKRVVQKTRQQEEQANSGQAYLMKALEKALPPIFISARCFDIANKWADLNEEEAFSLERLNSLYQGFEFSPEILTLIANFAQVEQKLQAVRDNKQRILDERFEQIMRANSSEIKHLLSTIQADIEQKRDNLLAGDIAQMEEKQSALVKKIESGQIRVNAVFEKQTIQLERNLIGLKNSIQQDAQAVKRIESQTGAREEAYEVGREESDSDWYNPFSWGDTKTVYSTHYRTVNYTYANVHDAVLKLEDFVLETQTHLYNASSQFLDLDRFKEEIKQAVKDLFDFSDDDFDPQMILLPLGNAVDRITIPSIQLDLEHHINTIREQFDSTEVEGDEIASLRNEQARVVALVIKEIVTEMDRSKDNMLVSLSEEQEKFIPALTKDLYDSVKQLKDDLKNKEQSLASYEKILSQLSQDIVEQSMAKAH